MEECCENCVYCAWSYNGITGSQVLICLPLTAKYLDDEVAPDWYCDNFYYREDNLPIYNNDEEIEVAKLKLLREQ